MRDAAGPPAPFHPDLIIEATNACDKTCPGCYAPNVLVDPRGGAPMPQVRHLSLGQLAQAWPNGKRVTLVSVRGGEPTLNPQIGGLLGYLRRRAPRIYLETNGDWIAPGHPLLAVLAGESCVAKLSLDRMHGSSAREASRRLAALSEAGVSAAVAVTETSLELFNQTRRRLLAGFQGELFWQRKASAQADLILPRLGVISAGGELRRSLTHNLASSVRWRARALPLALLGLLPLKARAARDVTIAIAANFSAMSDSTSNPYANYFRNAIEMAFEENKARLASKGLRVKIKELDYGDDKLKVIETANAAVESEALAVLGYIYSSDALLAGPILTKGQLLLLTPTATADRLERIGRFLRRTCFDDSYQGKILAEFAWNSQRVKRVGIVYAADCAYCASLRAAFKERFETLGGRVAVEQTVLSNDTAFAEVVAAFKGRPVDAIFVPNYERVAATIISQLLDAGIRPRLWLGGDGWGNSVDLFYRIMGQRQFTAYAISHWHLDLGSAASKAFVAGFVRRYGKPPVDTAALAYDAARLLIEGLLQAAPLTREGLLDAVERIAAFEGVTGKLAYPPLARTPAKPAVLLRLENGKTSRMERLIGAAP